MPTVTPLPSSPKSARAGGGAELGVALGDDRARCGHAAATIGASASLAACAPVDAVERRQPPGLHRDGRRLVAAAGRQDLGTGGAAASPRLAEDAVVEANFDHDPPAPALEAAGAFRRQARPRSPAGRAGSGRAPPGARARPGAARGSPSPGASRAQAAGARARPSAQAARHAPEAGRGRARNLTRAGHDFAYRPALTLP